jgi:hypothetical protein
MPKINWNLLISPTIITAIIALIGSPIFFTTLIDSFQKPNVSLEIISNFEGDGRKSIIELKNNGAKHATNISLVVFAPKNYFYNRFT